MAAMECFAIFKWKPHILRGKMVPGRPRHSYDNLMYFGRDLWFQGSWLVERSTSVEWDWDRYSSSLFQISQQLLLSFNASADKEMLGIFCLQATESSPNDSWTILLYRK